MKFVLKHGELYKKFVPTYTVTCPFCGCKFSYSEEGLKFVDGSGQVVKIMTLCPECKQHFEHSPAGEIV